MKALLKKHASKLRFGLVGATSTAIDFGLLFVGTNLGFNRFASNYVSTSVAFVFSFFANRSFTFKSKKDAKKQIIPFLVVTLFGLWVIQPIVIWLVSLPLSHLSDNITLFIAKLAATGVTLVWNYIFYAKFVFKD